MNKEVNFEIAILLQENGFDEVCRFYRKDNVSLSDCYQTNDFLKPGYYPAPTIAEVVMWLYEKHGIWIYIKQGYKWEWYIETVANHPELKYNDGLEDSPTEAYEEAIIYTLENLIQGGDK